MKRVLLIASVLAGMPAAALADESLWRFEVEATASTSYLYEREATIISRRPVINVTATWNQTADFSAYVWVQAGDRPAREIDVGESFEHEFGRVAVRAEVAAYFTQVTRPVYTATAGISVPLGSLSLDADVRRYEGAYRATVSSIDLSYERGRTTIALGHAWNRTDEGDRWSPTYGQVAYALTERSSIAVRAFTGHGSGLAVDLTHRF